MVATSRWKDGLPLTALPVQLAMARILGKLRMQGHDHCRKPSEDGGKANYRRECYGILAEMLVIEALERRGEHPTGYVLVARRTPGGQDITLNGVVYSIKSVPAGSYYLCINEEQRLSPDKACDFILPVVFRKAKKAVVLQPIRPAVVAEWELRKEHSYYRSIHVGKLQPLRRWEDLTVGYPGAGLILQATSDPVS